MVHVLVEWVTSINESVFEDGKVELVGGVCVVSRSGKGVVCTVVSEVSGEITSTLKAVVVVDNPACLEVGNVM